MLERDLMVLFRGSLDDKETRLERAYFVLKSFLRAMLIHKGDIKKKELLVEFQKEYGDKIIFPKKFERILNKEINFTDYEEILNFCNNCLKYLFNNLEREK